ncbi:hypothetical protein KZZ52_46115 [Dactylosporangium sp. AC04546]|uniref:hypothetical protein n=1 Tax=Dactylosporangium sp. AC04546 TaxID=2862460 RepID=UPI001EDCDCA9|nr:hypothetical protein [Dactylosporangium sp. AC04546]WVK81291.1 hypothetical protein KZZ52_46115 [Dactylosporangium sp. AC04546]
MGNSAVYRIHTGDDLAEAFAMARRLAAVAPPCCQPEVGASVTTGSHDLDRFADVDGMVCVQFPDARAATVLTPLLPPDELPIPRRDDGGVRVGTRLTPGLRAALRELPPVPAEFTAYDQPLPSPLPDTILALAGPEPATISWLTHWPGVHHESGFELSVNGAELWHRPPHPGHNLYVHVPPEMPELAAHLAALAGGAVLDGPVLGW